MFTHQNPVLFFFNNTEQIFVSEQNTQLRAAFVLHIYIYVQENYATVMVHNNNI
jgi:hypothetical protein